MMTRSLILAASAALFLVACGGGPVKRISPPAASVQELVVQPDGQWRLRVRVQNFSNVPMTFSAFKATLSVAGSEVGKISTVLDLDMAGGSADVIDVAMPASAAATQPKGDISYELKGTIDSSDPKGSYPFERNSHLSPVPGLPNTWR